MVLELDVTRKARIRTYYRSFGVGQHGMINRVSWTDANEEWGDSGYIMDATSPEFEALKFIQGLEPTQVYHIETGEETRIWYWSYE